MSGHPRHALPLFAQGELSAAETAEVELHVADCASCRAAVEQLRSTLGLLGALPRSEATFPDLLARRAREEACDARAEDVTLHAFEDGGEEVARHLAECSRCADRATAVRSVKAALAALPSSRASFAALRGRLRPSPWRRVPAAAAAAALIAALAGAPFAGPGRVPPAIPAPAAAAASPSRAAEVLARLDSLDEDSLRAAAARLDRQNPLHALGLAEAMDDTASFRRYAAIRLLRHLETPAAEDLLVRALGRSDSRDRMLVRALVELQSPHVVPWLISRLEDPAARPGAMEDLARIRDRSTIGALADHLDDPRAGELLARFESSDLVGVLDRHRNAAGFVRIPSPAVHAHLLGRGVKDPAFRSALLAAAAEAGLPGADFLLRATGNETLREAALARLNVLPTAVLERAAGRALDRDELASAAVRVVGELQLEALLPKVRRAMSSGRVAPEEALPVLATLGDLDTLIFVAKLRNNPKLAKVAAAALEKADPMLRSEALVAAAPAEERVIYGRASSSTKPGRFRRDQP